MSVLRPGIATRLPERRLVIGAGLSLAIGAFAAAVISLSLPEGIFLFRAEWLLHPFEQEHLTIARHLAREGSLVIAEADLDAAYGSEDKGYVDGRFVPRGVILPYLIYAAAFFVSDTAWLYVTPVFGLLAVVAAGFIVHRRTRSQAAGIGAAAALLCASPFLLAASGLAYENLIALAAAGIGTIFGTNYLITGYPLRSAYGSGWQGSAGGVARNFVAFDPDKFLLLARFFLWEVGRPSVLVLAIGLGAALLARRLRLDEGDVIFLGISVVLIVLHLGRSGLHATDAPGLISSPPRYLLPVYAAGLVMGFTFLGRALGALPPIPFAPTALVLAFGAVAAVGGLREAYANPAGIPEAEFNVQRLRAVHDFSSRHPDALFVGDLNTKAVIVTVRTLIPRLVGDAAGVTGLVKAELARGRDVFIVDDRRHLVDHPLYSGYFESLSRAGLSICPAPFGPLMISEVVPKDTDGKKLVGRVSVSSTLTTPALGPVLDQGRVYYVTVEGTFAYNAAGARSDGVDLWVDDTRVSSVPSPGHSYCLRVTGAGRPVQLQVRDSTSADNRGDLRVAVYRTD